MKFIKRKIIPLFLISLMLMQTASCGYILHPERRKQFSTGKVDYTIVAMDAIGLLFFIIPGVIAFAIDINNNTIYLPLHEKRSSSNPQNIAIKIDGEITKEKIALIVKEKTGKDIDLNAKMVVLQDARQKYALLN